MSGRDGLIQHSGGRDNGADCRLFPHCASNPTWKNNEVAKSACATFPK